MSTPNLGRPSLNAAGCRNICRSSFPPTLSLSRLLPALDDEPIAGRESVGAARGEFDDRIRAGESESAEGAHPRNPFDPILDEPADVDRIGNEEGVDPPPADAGELEDERVVVGDRPEHQSPASIEGGVSELNAARDCFAFAPVVGFAYEFHGRTFRSQDKNPPAAPAVDSTFGTAFDPAMEKTPRGTAVGVDDPYDHAGVCDHLTDDGRCRYAIEYADSDPEFARKRACEEYACPIAADAEAAGEAPDWADCPHYRFRADDRVCARCGLEERRDGLSAERPLLEEHHLSYARSGGEGDGESGDGGGDETEGGEDGASHEITVFLCRWCHAKVHGSWARIDDDASPPAEAVAAREERRGKEMAEGEFSTAAERYDRD